MDLRPALYGLDQEEIQKIVREENAPAYRAKQILDWLYKKNIASFGTAKNLPKNFLECLERRFSLHALSLGEEHRSKDNESIKFLFRTRDGECLESVLITRKGRRTVCVSTQLGCKIGCVFCASGKGKFKRDLSAGEIIEQLVWIQRNEGKTITNVVFMGMGEPLDNFDETMKALNILQAPWGFKLGARRITVSTVGIPSKMIEFVKRSEGKVRLSVSLHSGNETTRSKIVPINKRYPVKELGNILKQIHRQLKREITLEHTLIDGINDSDEEALGIAKFAKPLDAKVNIIPCNPVQGEEFKAPSTEKMKHFRGILERKGVRVTVRRTAGQDIDAACGQLRLMRGKRPQLL